MGLIGTALGVAGTIYGGISASKAMRSAMRDIENQRQENRNWYDRNYNMDSTQRADAQALLTRTQDAIRNRNRAAAGTAAVMGATDESVAAEKEAGNRLMGDVVSQINAAGEARKDKIENQYLETDRNLRQQQSALKQQQAQAIAGAVQGLAGAAGGMGF